jgi:hypothetical protein
MTNARKMRPLHEMYSQEEIDRATAHVIRVHKNGPDDVEENRVADWGDFAGCFDSTESYIEPAIRAVLARRWHSVNGPQEVDVQPLPLGAMERSNVRRDGVGSIFVWFARSLAHLDYDITLHPSFYDYACGALAFEHEGSERLEQLKHRFPPRLLPGLDRSTRDWSPPTVPSAEQENRGSR